MTPTVTRVTADVTAHADGATDADGAPLDRPRRCVCLTVSQAGDCVLLDWGLGSV